MAFGFWLLASQQLTANRQPPTAKSQPPRANSQQPTTDRERGFSFAYFFPPARLSL